MTGGDKAQSAIMLLRSMNPQVLALDEITAPEDAEACEKAANCGVSILTTAHAGDIDQLRGRYVYRRLLESGIFAYAVVISGRGGDRRYEVVEMS
jgi:stage III sporulation protein AA